MSNLQIRRAAGCLLLAMGLLRFGKATASERPARRVQETDVEPGCGPNEAYSLYKCQAPLSSFVIPCDNATCLWDLDAFEANQPPGFCGIIDYDLELAEYPDILKPCVLWDELFGTKAPSATVAPAVAPLALTTTAPTVAPTILSTIEATVTTTAAPSVNTNSTELMQSHVDFGSVLWHVYFDTIDGASIERNVLNLQTEVETIAPAFMEEKLQEVLFQFSDSITVQLSLTPLMEIPTVDDMSIASFSVTGRVTFQAEYAPRAVAVRDIVVSWMTAQEFIEYWQEQSSTILVDSALYSTHGPLDLPETNAPTFTPQSIKQPKQPAVTETDNDSSSDEAPVWHFWEHIEFLDWGNYYFIGFVSLCGSLLIMVLLFVAVCCLRRRRRRLLAKEAQSIAKVLTVSHSGNSNDDAKYDLEYAKRNLSDSRSEPDDDDESWTRTDGSTLPESTLPSTFPEDAARAPSPNTSLYSYTEQNKLEDMESQASDDNGFSMDFGANVSGIVLPKPELDESVDLPPSEPSEMPEPAEAASMGSIPVIAVDLSLESEQKGTVLVYEDNDDCSLSTTSDSMYGEYPARDGSPVKMFTSQPPKVLSRYPLPTSITDSPTKSSKPLSEPKPPTKKVLNRYPMPQSLLSPPKKEVPPPSSPSKSAGSPSPGKKSSVLAAVAKFEASMNKNKPWIKDDEPDAEPTVSSKEPKPATVSPESRKSTDTTSAASPDSSAKPSPTRLVVDEVEAADLTMPTPDTADIATPVKSGNGQGPPRRDLSSPKKLSSRLGSKEDEIQIKSIFRSKGKMPPPSSRVKKAVSKFDAVVEKPKTTTAEKLSSVTMVTPNHTVGKKPVKMIDRSDVGKENGFFGRRSHSESPSKRPPKPSFVLKTDIDAVQGTSRRNRRSQSVAPSTRFQGMANANDVLDRSIETSLTWASTAGFSLRSGRTSKASQSLLEEENESEFGVPTTLPPTPQTPSEYSESETSDIQSICSKEFSFKGKRDGSENALLRSSQLTAQEKSRLGVGKTNSSDGIRLPATYQ